MKKLILLFAFATTFALRAQTTDEAAIRQIYDEALANGKSYSMLEYLSTKIGARLSGSEGAAKAVDWSKKTMEEFGFDSVWLQPVMVPHWVRGSKEIGTIRSSNAKTKPVNAPWEPSPRESQRKL